ncbi:hypothetical protein WJX82_011550 [Trebouxia sp. C0006]
MCQLVNRVVWPRRACTASLTRHLQSDVRLGASQLGVTAVKGLLDLPWQHADLQSRVLVSSVLTRQRPLIWQHKGGMASFRCMPDPLQERVFAAAAIS